jgi:hypothetical protein
MSVHQLAHAHAPILHLHPRESYLPMSVDEFCRGAVLTRIDAFSHDRTGTWDVARCAWCADADHAQRVAPGVPLEVLAQFGADRGYVRRPHQRPYLDGLELVALEHTSRRPTPATSHTPAPCWFDIIRDDAHEVHIAYWFFYGYSEFISVGFIQFAHQGDWEHVVARFVRDGTGTPSLHGMWYFAHGEAFYRVVHTQELLVDDGRPHVFVARNRHGCYWEPGAFYAGTIIVEARERRADTTADSDADAADVQLFNDECVASAAPWDTRAELLSLAECVWREFAGAWGRVGRFKRTTGPLGPWYKRAVLAPGAE